MKALILAIMLVLVLVSPVFAGGDKQHGDVGQGLVHQNGECPHYGDW